MGLKNFAQRVVNKAWSVRTGKPVPATGTRRVIPRQNTFKRSFAAGKLDNVTASFTGSYLSINEELRRDLRRIRGRSRQLFMDNDYIKKFGGMCKKNVVGVKGIVLQSRAVDHKGDLDETDNKIIENGWKQWGKPHNCTVNGRLSWRDVQNLVAITVPRDGEVLIQLIDKPSSPFGFIIKVLSADYLDEQFNKELPNGHKIVMGVETDPDGLVVAYHLREEQVGSYQNVYAIQKYKRVPARDIIHLFVADWPDQRRGLPWTHTAVRRLMMIGRYEEAEMVAAAVGASSMGFFSTPDGDGSELVDNLAPKGQDNDDSDLVQEAEPGSFRVLPEGTTFSSFDPQHPSTAFDPFMKALLRGGASGLEVAYNSLANDLENVNFSSIRAGTLEERDGWKVIQSWLIEHLCERVYERWLQAAIMNKKLALPFKKIDDKYMAIFWQPRGWPWVDPYKDAKASSEKISTGTGTRTADLAAQGEDFKDTIDQLAYEQKVAEQAGVDITPIGKQTEAETNGTEAED